MKLTDMTLKTFMEKLGSSAPAPGGGSVAALSGALGAALVSMVCNLTAGKPKYMEYEPLVKEVLEKSDALMSKLLDAIHTDTEAFNSVMAAFGMPKETDAQKIDRSEAIQKAYKAAIASPESTADYCFKVMKLAESLLGKSNINAVSDLAVGAAQAYAGLKGALVNVRINLPPIKDTEYIAEKRTWLEHMETEAEALLQRVEKRFILSGK